eukprot:15121537-Ditylum_brightwellii.AAC.1
MALVMYQCTYCGTTKLTNAHSGDNSTHLVHKIGPTPRSSSTPGPSDFVCWRTSSTQQTPSLLLVLFPYTPHNRVPLLPLRDITVPNGFALQGDPKSPIPQFVLLVHH